MFRKVFMFLLALTFLIPSGLYLIRPQTNTNITNAVNDDSAFDMQGSAAAILMDQASGKVLFEKNKTDKLPIASMTKLMTLKLLFDEIDAGRASMDEKVVISEHAASQEGSQAFLDAGKEYIIGDLVKTVVISSANDSAVAIAERVSGSEQAFALAMNKKATELGCLNTQFKNATGLPAPDQFSTAEDVSKILSSVCENKNFLKFSGIYMDELIHPSGRKTELVNTNRLIRNTKGCDGGKTGFTNEAGYCLAATAKRENTRLIAVVMGAADSKGRFAFAGELLNYGFSHFKSKLVLDSNKALQTIEVKGAEVKTAEIFAKFDFSVLTAKSSTEEFKTEITLVKKIKAPLAFGDVVGTVKVLNSNGETVFETDVIVKTNIKRITWADGLHRILEAW